METIDHELRERANQVLAENGFVQLPSQFQVGGIQFDVPDVFLGPPGTLSLTILLDRPSGREESGRVYWLAQRLARALDAQDSRRSMNVVIVGGPPEDKLLADMQTIARVLVLDRTLEVKRLLGPLLPFGPLATMGVSMSGLEGLDNFVRGSKESSGLQSLVRAASEGEKAVEMAYLRWIDSSIERSES